MPAAAVAMLLEHCSTVLSEAAEALYEVLFSLAQDDWPQVSSFCQTWLRKHATGTMQVKPLLAFKAIYGKSSGITP